MMLEANTLSPCRSITEEAVNHALLKSLNVIGIENVTPHDPRRTAATQMTELGIHRLVVSKINTPYRLCNAPKRQSRSPLPSRSQPTSPLAVYAQKS